MWQLPNLRFEAVAVEQVQGEFDLALLIDVIHHLTHEQEQAIVAALALLLKPGGRLLAREMDDGHCSLGIFLDTYVSRCPPVVRNRQELCDSLSRHLQITTWKQGIKSGIGYVQILAEKAVTHAAPLDGLANGLCPPSTRSCAGSV